MPKEDVERAIHDVGRRVSEVRLGLALTQEQLAERLGMSLKGYQRIERGLENMTIRRLVRVANALGVRPIELWALPGSREVRRGRPPR
jgi:transcriptional regulator with XRE-family HTH domain